MNRGRSFWAVVAATFVIALNGCATYPRSGSDAVLGKWSNSRGTLLTMMADGTFSSVRADSIRPVWGTYTIAHHAITFRAVGGDTSKSCRDNGVYQFAQISDDTLELSVVSDSCKVRRRDLASVWHRGAVNPEPWEALPRSPAR